MAFGDYVNGAANVATGSGDLVVTFGFTATAGNLLVAHSMLNASGTTPTLVDNIDTDGSDWVLIDTDTAVGLRCKSWAKIAAGGETSATYNSQSGGSDTRACGVAQFTGPFQSATPQTSSGNITMVASATSVGSTSLAVATSVDGELYVAAIGHTVSAGGAPIHTWTGDATERFDTGARISFASAVIANDGTTPASACSWSSNVASGLLLVAFLPQAGGANVSGTAAISASVTTTVTGTRTVTGTAAISASAATTVTGTRKVLGTAALAESATITASGSTSGAPQVSGTAQINASATITATGVRTVTGTAALTETVTVTVVGARAVAGAALIAMSVTITVLVVTYIDDPFPYTATWTLTYAGTVDHDYRGTWELV